VAGVPHSLPQLALSRLNGWEQHASQYAGFVDSGGAAVWWPPGFVDGAGVADAWGMGAFEQPFGVANGGDVVMWRSDTPEQPSDEDMSVRAAPVEAPPGNPLFLGFAQEAVSGIDGVDVAFASAVAVTLLPRPVLVAFAHYRDAIAAATSTSEAAQAYLDLRRFASVVDALTGSASLSEVVARARDVPMWLCCARVGVHSREAFLEALGRAFGGHLDDALRSQMLGSHAKGTLGRRVQGAFRSRIAQRRTRRGAGGGGGGRRPAAAAAAEDWRFEAAAEDEEGQPAQGIQEYEEVLQEEEEGASVGDELPAALAGPAAAPPGSQAGMPTSRAPSLVESSAFEPVVKNTFLQFEGAISESDKVAPRKPAPSCPSRIQNAGQSEEISRSGSLSSSWDLNPSSLKEHDRRLAGVRPQQDDHCSPSCASDGGMQHLASSATSAEVQALDVLFKRYQDALKALHSKDATDREWGQRILRNVTLSEESNGPIDWQDVMEWIRHGLHDGGSDEQQYFDADLCEQRALLAGLRHGTEPLLQTSASARHDDCLTAVHRALGDLHLLRAFDDGVKHRVTLGLLEHEFQPTTASCVSAHVGLLGYTLGGAAAEGKSHWSSKRWRAEDGSLSILEKALGDILDIAGFWSRKAGVVYEAAWALNRITNGSEVCLQHERLREVAGTLRALLEATNEVRALGELECLLKSPDRAG